MGAVQWWDHSRVRLDEYDQSLKICKSMNTFYQPNRQTNLSVRYKIGKLAYLADIFSRLNDRSSSPQGYCINIFTVRNKTLKKVDFLVINVCKKATLICSQVCKILWQVPLLTLKSYLLL